MGEIKVDPVRPRKTIPADLRRARIRYSNMVVDGDHPSLARDNLPGRWEDYEIYSQCS